MDYDRRPEKRGRIAYEESIVRGYEVSFFLSFVFSPQKEVWWFLSHFRQLISLVHIKSDLYILQDLSLSLLSIQLFLLLLTCREIPSFLKPGISNSKLSLVFGSWFKYQF